MADCRNIVALLGLLELNLSQNEIGPESAAALFEFLCREDCPLERLVLANADVSSVQCQVILCLQ